MKLRFYKIANVIWLISFLIGGYSTICLGILRDSFTLTPVIICFVIFFLCYGLGLTGLKKEKEHRKDFLFSFIGGATYFVLCLIYVIKAIISLQYMGLINTMFPLVAFLLSILQLLATFLAIKKAEGPLFSKDSDDKAIIINDFRKASIEIFYYVVYLLMAVLLGYIGFTQGNRIYSYIIEMGYQRVTGYGAYMQYQTSSIVVPFALSVIAFITTFGSYIWFAKDKRGKAGSVFTMITLVSFTSLYGYYLVASFGGIGVFITIVIASTLFNKNDDKIQIKGKPLTLLIVVCASLFVVFVVQEYTIIKDNILNAGQAKNIPFIYYIMQNGVSNYYDYYNYMYDVRYNYYGYYGVLNMIGSYSPTYVLFPIVVLVILMKKQTTSKKFLQRVMFTIFFSLLMLGITSLISRIFNAEFYRTIGAPAEYTGSYITPAIVAHFAVSFIALAAYIIIKAQKPLVIQAEDTVDNKVEKVTKTRLIIDTIKVPLLVIVSVLFAFVIPIISDNFKQSVTCFSLLNSNDVMSVSDYLLRNTLQWGFLFTAFSLLLYLFFALGFYDKKPKTIQVFEYILCGVQIIMYVALLIMVIVSNTSFNTSFNTLAALPMCFYIIWLLAIIVLNNKTFVLACAEKTRNFIGQRRNKAAIRKERRQEKAIEAKRRKEEEELRRQEELERQRQLALELEKRRQEEELRRQKEEEERRRNNELHANQQTVMVTPSSDDKIRQIKELLQLREEGAITEEEFLTLKKEIIGGGKNDEEK